MSAIPTSNALIPLRVAITSDTICPFCYIGLRKLERAFASSPYTSPSSPNRLFDPQIRFLPFQLDPTLPRDAPTSKRERYITKFAGSEQRLNAMEQMMIQRGKEVGINFSYGGPIRSTLDSHRILDKAYATGGQDMQLRLVNTLFAAYFENEQDPGSPELLSKLSTEAGVFPSEEAARTFLSSNEGIAEVQRAFREASLVKGISGVPHFELTAETGKAYSEEKTYEIPGAQESETMVAVIERLAQEVKGKMANGGNATAAAPGARC